MTGMEDTGRTRNDTMTVQQLGSGWAAVHMIEVEAKFTDKNGVVTYDWYWDVQQTGIGRYSSRDGAFREAVSWSMSDEIPLEECLQKELYVDAT